MIELNLTGLLKDIRFSNNKCPQYKWEYFKDFLGVFGYAFMRTCYDNQELMSVNWKLNKKEFTQFCYQITEIIQQELQLDSQDSIFQWISMLGVPEKQQQLTIDSQTKFVISYIGILLECMKVKYDLQNYIENLCNFRQEQTVTLTTYAYWQEYIYKHDIEYLNKLLFAISNISKKIYQFLCELLRVDQSQDQYSQYAKIPTDLIFQKVFIQTKFEETYQMSLFN